MYDTVVAIDLETSGIDPYQDHIIEVGAAVLRGGVVVERFSELVRCPVPLTPSIIKLTGITPEMLKDARSVDAVLADLVDFLPKDALIIAHNAQFEISWLRVATKDLFRRIILDTVELSRICFPTFASHNLGVLCDELSIEVGDSHRALDDCLTLLAVWQKMIERLHEIPLPVVSEMNFLLNANRQHPYHDLFRRLEAELNVLRAAPGSIETLYKEDAPATPRPPSEEEDWSELDEQGVFDLLGPNGAFAKYLPGYEYRDGQQSMARAVAKCYNEGKHLFVEAGTGIGKSMAYLLPSVLMAVQNRTPVVISTNTKNLQAQLFEKDLPLLRKVLNLDFKAALIKGRRNYLCIRKLLYVLQQAGSELDREERMRMLNVLPWSVWTRTGDISENIVSDRPGFGGVWSKLSTVGDECMGRGCRHFKRCLLRRARAKALDADVVVANHSLVFAELNVKSKSPALPPHHHIVFDEAHNLEEAATSHLSVEVSQARLGFALSRLYRRGKRDSRTGLLMSIRGQIESEACRAEDELRTQCLERIDEAAEGLEAVTAEMKTFFSALETLLLSVEDSGTLRFQSDRKRASVWKPVEDAQAGLLACLARIMHPLEGLRDHLKEMKPGDLSYQRDATRDLEASIQWLREISEDMVFAMDGSNEEYVYWVERASPKMGGARAIAAPRKVGPLLHDQIYARKKSVIFSSATLSVRKQFDFLKKRLGVDLVEPERLIEMDVGTPFDYPKQCLVAVPMFLPEPGERARSYPQELGQLLAEVFRRTQGRAMGLFTSYDMLRRSSEVMEKEMVGDGINILVQGRSGSRESMTATFKRDIHSVLMGTHSFWEGVDVAGEALSCVAIARLPFAVFTDPIVQARCEQVESDGGNAFLGYSLPSAVVRFRQGFGRLIRHKNDRGVVIVADRRMISKRYGQWFRESIPAPTEVFTDRQAFLDAIEEFLLQDEPVDPAPAH